MVASFLTLTLVLLAGAGCSKPYDDVGRLPVSGTIETDEAHLASRYGGRVENIFAQEGDSLKAGQVIITLAAPELPVRRAHAASVLEELEHGPRPEEIATAKHDWEAVVSDLELARAENRRIQDLFQRRTVAETDRDRAASRVNTLERSAAAARDRYDLLLAGTRPERIVQARAELAEIETQLREMRILAPTNCVLETLSVKIGDVLPANREAATVLTPQHLWVRVYVPEPWLGLIPLGQAVKVRVDSFAQRDFNGIVEQINRAAEFTPRNAQTVEDRIKQVFGVKVRLANETGELRPGMAADVAFPNVPGVKAAPAK